MVSDAVAEQTEIHVDTTRLNQVLLDLQEALGTAGQPADLSDIVRDETRRLAEAIVRITPPKSRKLGMDRIEKDLKSIFSEADIETIDEIGSEHGLTNIDTWIGKKEKIHLKWGRIDPTGARIKENHRESMKTGRVLGRVLKEKEGIWRAKYIIPRGMRSPYVKQVQKHVGRWKATWAKVAVDLGSKVVSWIGDHIAGNPKAISDTKGLMDGSFPKVTFGSRAPGVRRQEALIKDALRIRQEAIRKRIKIILSGYAKDVWHGVRAQSRAKRSGNGGSHVISG